MTPTTPTVSVPTPHEFQILPARECPFYDCGPWLGPARRAQGLLGYWKQHIASADGYDARMEHSVMFLFNAEGQLLGHIYLAKGSSSSVAADACVWFGPARALGAVAFVDAHSHPIPPGNSQPSEMDIMTARLLAWHGKARKFPMLDFVAVGDGECYSLAANGLLDGADAVQSPEEDSDVYVSARDKWRLSVELLFPDRDLQSLVIDEAHKTGVGVEDWVFEHVRGMLRLELSGLGAVDPKPLLVSSVLKGEDEKLLLGALRDEAADGDLTPWECGWELAVKLVRDHLRKRAGLEKALSL